MQVDGVSKFEELAEGRCLCNVEREDLVVIQMTCDQGVHAAPSTAETNRSEEQPGVSFSQMRKMLRKLRILLRSKP